MSSIVLDWVFFANLVFLTQEDSLILKPGFPKQVLQVGRWCKGRGWGEWCKGKYDDARGGGGESDARESIMMQGEEEEFARGAELCKGKVWYNWGKM